MQDIKDQHIKELKELVREFISAKNGDFANGHHWGSVVDNNDPGKDGKCRIMVKGVFEGLPNDTLPWAVPDQTFVGSLQGNFVVPEIGSLVNVYFRNGDINFPHYSTMVIDKNNQSTLKDEDYPHTFIVFESPNGDYIKINKKTNEFMIRSAGGVTIVSDKSGNLDIDNTNSLVGNINITARGIFTLDAAIVQTPNGVVVPTGTGFLCAMPVDPLTGLPQTGSMGIRQG